MINNKKLKIILNKLIIAKSIKYKIVPMNQTGEDIDIQSNAIIKNIFKIF